MGWFWPYLEDLGTYSGMDFERFRVEAAPTTLTLLQVPGTSCHPHGTAGVTNLGINLQKKSDVFKQAQCSREDESKDLGFK